MTGGGGGGGRKSEPACQAEEEGCARKGAGECVGGGGEGTA